MAQTQQAPAVKPGISTWNIDPAHSNAQFSVRHMMISNVRGEFTKVSGKARFDKDHPSEGFSVEATIDVNTINTREPDRDKHLKSPDFFDAEKYPTITFNSTGAETKGDQTVLTGDFTMHGVTKQISL